MVGIYQYLKRALSGGRIVRVARRGSSIRRYLETTPMLRCILTRTPSHERVFRKSGTRNEKIRLFLSALSHWSCRRTRKSLDRNVEVGCIPITIAPRSSLPAYPSGAATGRRLKGEEKNEVANDGTLPAVYPVPCHNRLGAEPPFRERPHHNTKQRRPHFLRNHCWPWQYAD
jgi:hypothetical protein